MSLIYHLLKPRLDGGPGSGIEGHRTARKASLLKKRIGATQKIGLQKVSTDKLQTMQVAKDTKKGGVESFRRKIRNKEKIAPIRVVHVQETNKFKIVDGHHRFKAYQKEGIKNIPVDVTISLPAREATAYVRDLVFG